jgi:hypothetical protein
LLGSYGKKNKTHIFLYHSLYLLQIKWTLNSIYWSMHTWVSGKKEASMNIFTDSQKWRSTLKPVNVLVYGWIGGEHACIDLTEVSPLLRMENEDFTMRYAKWSNMKKHIQHFYSICVWQFLFPNIWIFWNFKKTIFFYNSTIKFKIKENWNFVKMKIKLKLKLILV